MKRTAFAPTEPKPSKGSRPRKCGNRECRKSFVPPAPFVKWCCHDCAAVIGMQAVEKIKAKEQKKIRQAQREDRRATKVRLEEFKPLAYFLGIAERHCNAYIRARDPDICISCDVTYSSSWQAGHYISVGANGTLRFNEDNIHKQCIQCNMYAGGNAVQYRMRLEKKIGAARLAALEAWHPPVKMTVEAAKEIAEHYKGKLRALSRPSPRSCADDQR